MLPVHMSRCWQAFALLVVCFGIVDGATLLADEWPRFRGPNGDGKSDLKGVPTNWTQDDYEWVIKLPGKGHSSPSIWGDHLFVLTGTDAGVRTLICLNALTGEEFWKDSTESLSASHLHNKNSYGSGTPATNGEHVYVAFADENHYLVNAYTMNGEKIWTRDLGTFTSQHGQGVSPLIYKDLVIVPFDQMGPSQMLALNTKTGETVWTTQRDFRKTSYATPIVVDVNGQDQLITLSGAIGLSGIDLKDGTALWSSGQLPMRTVASPVYGAGLVIASCGSGGQGKFMVAVDPTQGDNPEKIVKAERKKNLPYVPTPIIDGNYMYLWNDGGIVCCVDLTTDLSENVWTQRIGGNFSGSPVLIDGKLYCISEDGEVAVIAASPEYKEYGKSPLGDQSYSTPAVANGRVYFRGFHSLACLKAKEATAN